MPRNAWKEIVSWRTRRLNNSTKYQLHALMTVISKKKNWNPWENCQKYALKLIWNAKTWHVLEDPIFHGQWTNLHDQSQNGPKPVTNVWIDWFHIFITRVNTNNIVMWEILLSNADWDCFKTPISQEILKIQNPHEVNIVHFWKAYICSDKFGVLETNFIFVQFNKFRNHFLGRRIEIGRYARTWLKRSDRRNSSRKHVSEIKNGTWFVLHFANFKHERNLMEWLMI